MKNIPNNIFDSIFCLPSCSIIIVAVTDNITLSKTVDIN